jgi:GNAT superfamily N-acetyltransferase
MILYLYMDDVEIRKAEIPDIEIIKGFQLLLALESEGISLDQGILQQGIQAIFDDGEKGQYYVAVTEGKVIASLMITREWSDWRNGSVWWIQSVYVAKQHRKSGVFKKMYEYLKNVVIQDPSVRGLRLYVDNHNENALAVYGQLGMDGNHYKVFEWMKDI